MPPLLFTFQSLAICSGPCINGGDADISLQYTSIARIFHSSPKLKHCTTLTRLSVPSFPLQLTEHCRKVCWSLSDKKGRSRDLTPDLLLPQSQHSDLGLEETEPGRPQCRLFRRSLKRGLGRRQCRLFRQSLERVPARRHYRLFRPSLERRLELLLS